VSRRPAARVTPLMPGSACRLVVAKWTTRRAKAAPCPGRASGIERGETVDGLDDPTIQLCEVGAFGGSVRGPVAKMPSLQNLSEAKPLVVLVQRSSSSQALIPTRCAASFGDRLPPNGGRRSTPVPVYVPTGNYADMRGASQPRPSDCTTGPDLGRTSTTRSEQLLRTVQASMGLPCRNCRPTTLLRARFRQSVTTGDGSPITSRARASSL
jgi:hypothetical protein